MSLCLYVYFLLCPLSFSSLNQLLMLPEFCMFMMCNEQLWKAPRIIIQNGMVKTIFVHTVAFWSGAEGGSLPCSCIFRLTAAFRMPPGPQWEPLPCTGVRQHCSADPSKAAVPAECLGQWQADCSSLLLVVEPGAETGNHCLAKTSRWWRPSSVGDTVSHWVFPSGTHWLATKLGPWLGTKLSASTELWHHFSSWTSAFTADSSGMFFMWGKNFHVLTHGFSVFGCHPNLHRHSLLMKVRSKAGCFWNICYLGCITRKAKDAHFELLPHAKAQLMNPWDRVPWDHASQKSLKRLPY